MNTDWLTVTTAEGPMQVYRARPADPIVPSAAILVLQEAFGVNDHIQDVTRRVAAEGYLALAPELFHRTGGGALDYADHATAMSLIDALGPAQIHADVTAVLTYLRQQEHVPTARTGLLGFCFGGRAAFTAATATPGLGGTVVFYGPGIVAGPHAVIDRVDHITGPVLMLLGEEDPTIPAEDREAIQAAAENVDAEVDIEVFPHAGHAFHCDARPALYVEHAAHTAWLRAISFLATTVAEATPRGTVT